MPRNAGRYRVLVKGSEEAMLALRMEVAEELGLREKIEKDGFRSISTFEAGQIGGTIVRKLQALGEKMVMDRYKARQYPLITPEMLPDEDDMTKTTNNGNQVVDGKIQPTSDMTSSPVADFVSQAIYGKRDNNVRG